MKKIGIIICACLVIASTVVCVIYNIYNYLTNKKKSYEQLQKTYAIISDYDNSCNVNNSISNEETVTNNKDSTINKENITKDKIICSDNVLGILEIPSLNIKAPIQDGTSQEIMKTSIGHFTESNYWNGNVSLASHNGGTNAHYFENIKNLKENDEINYTTKLGTKKYKVTGIYKISNTDWSMVNKVNNQVNQNTITLVTCINGQPNYRLCVRGVEL